MKKTLAALQNQEMTKNLSGVGSTVEAFADRMKRKLKEQESLQDETRKACVVRHQQMLQSLTTIRKALNETSRISLGERFHFELEIADWEGWPRLDLNLIDSLYPEVSSQALVITAHDRNELGLIQMSLKTGEVAGRLLLKEPGEFEKVPSVLKRAIRHFLDSVTPLILNPAPAPSKSVLESKALEEEQPLDSDTKKKLSSAELFADDQGYESDNIIQSQDVKPIDGIH